MLYAQEPYTGVYDVIKDSSATAKASCPIWPIQYVLRPSSADLNRICPLRVREACREKQSYVLS